MLSSLLRAFHLSLASPRGDQFLDLCGTSLAAVQLQSPSIKAGGMEAELLIFRPLSSKERGICSRREVAVLLLDVLSTSCG